MRRLIIIISVLLIVIALFATGCSEGKKRHFECFTASGKLLVAGESSYIDFNGPRLFTDEYIITNTSCVIVR